MSRGLHRRPWESLPSHVERVWLDDLFDGASVSEVAEFCDCKPELIDKVRGRFERLRRMREAWEHAELIRDRIGWPFDASSLITIALERYAERVTRRPKTNGVAVEGARRG